MKRMCQLGQIFQGAASAPPGWTVLTGPSQTCQHGSRSRSICHCLMVSITILMRDLVLSITSALGCHRSSPSCGCEDASVADFYIAFPSGATAERKPEQYASDHSYRGHFNTFNSLVFSSFFAFPHDENGWLENAHIEDGPPSAASLKPHLGFKCGPYWCFISMMTSVSTWILALMRGHDIAFLPALRSESQQEY